MKSIRPKEEICSDLVFSALSRLKQRQDALENLVKGLQGEVQILANTKATDMAGSHQKSNPLEDLSKSFESCREKSNFADLFRLREENFELKREIQRLDHALQIAKNLRLDLGHSSPLMQNTSPAQSNSYQACQANFLGASRCEIPNISRDSYKKYVEFQHEVAQTRMDCENPSTVSTNGCEIQSEKERKGYYRSASSNLHPTSTTDGRHHHHGEKYPHTTPRDQSFISPRHTRENFSANQQNDAFVVHNEAPPMERTGRSDRIKYALGHAQISSRDLPSTLPKRTREDIRQQLLEDAFLVLQKSGGRYIKRHVQ